MTSETKSGLSGNQKRKMKSAARFFAVQALFQMEHSEQTYDQVRLQFLDHRFGEIIDDYEMLEGDSSTFSTLLEEAVNNQALIDQMTDRALVAKWPLGRIDSTLRALFRAAGAELTQMDTPPKVVIVEFVQVAQAFFPEGKEAKFVNGVLDHMAREAKPEAF
ncbi:transcription antitermination factor NusB [Cognatishimia sp. 1_MG-2023]|uniref:transcription antitermination factor NusB n=1 Tax=Cognatishimia sp. 1_MG-2023 TaxID=3062642 RepID=UPI0026E1267E|nr:transcription antitermination factor NusB [Cognatishimia sp. 1_MG-2023]MDO6725692.1 transcription antitermination factor NusB [Cognatishimia sp. 1_MG-2023]